MFRLYVPESSGGSWAPEGRGPGAVNRAPKIHAHCQRCQLSTSSPIKLLFSYQCRSRPCREAEHGCEPSSVRAGCPALLIAGVQGAGLPSGAAVAGLLRVCVLLSQSRLVLTCVPVPGLPLSHRQFATWVTKRTDGPQWSVVSGSPSYLVLGGS